MVWWLRYPSFILSLSPSLFTRTVYSFLCFLFRFMRKIYYRFSFKMSEREKWRATRKLKRKITKNINTNNNKRWARKTTHTSLVAIYVYIFRANTPLSCCVLVDVVCNRLLDWFNPILFLRCAWNVIEIQSAQFFKNIKKNISRHRI